MGSLAKAFVGQKWIGGHNIPYRCYIRNTGSPNISEQKIAPAALFDPVNP